MSRSYRKFPLYSYLRHEFYDPDWRKIREHEQRCIFDEMKALENGDVIFPRYYVSGSNGYYPMKTIWDEYLTEIRNILNEYSYYDGYDGHFYTKNDFKADFIENFDRIKNGQEPTNFDWLKINKIRKIIKAWNGEPIDVLYYLNHHRIIEKAANIEFKRLVRK